MEFLQVTFFKCLQTPHVKKLSKTSIFYPFVCIFSVKGKLGIGKKGPGGAKGVEYDAMGSKWNKAMWDNMESKYV